MTTDDANTTSNNNSVRRAGGGDDDERTFNYNIIFLSFFSSCVPQRWCGLCVCFY